MAALSVALLFLGALIQTAVFAADAGSDARANAHASAASLREAHDHWLNVLAGNDVDAIMSAVAADAMLLPTDGELISGREALRAYYRNGIEQRNEELELSVSNIEVVVEGNLGYTLGTYTITDADGEVMHRGKYLELWRRENGAWKLSRDISNSSLPARPPLPAASERPADNGEPFRR